MGPLLNSKHERFAQELAEGKSMNEAYEAAGYKPSRPHALDWQQMATFGGVWPNCRKRGCGES